MWLLSPFVKGIFCLNVEMALVKGLLKPKLEHYSNAC
jgi:hypothetical protein